jgi:hypothetical protein
VSTTAWARQIFLGVDLRQPPSMNGTSAAARDQRR